MWLFNLFLILIVLYFSLWLWNRRKFYYMEWKIKGPSGYPFIGVGLNFLNRKNVLKFLDECNKKYGRYYYSFLGIEPFLIVNDPVLIEQIYNSENMIKKSNTLYNPIKNTLGDGLFTSENPKWTHDRKLINKAFKHKILVNFFPIFNNQGRIVNDLIIEKCVGKGECDVLEEFSSLTLYTTMITTMGEDQGDFQSSECKCLIDKIYRAQHILAERLCNPLFNFVYPVHPLRWKMNKIIKEVRQYINSRIEKRFTMLAKIENEKALKTDQNQNNFNENIDITKEQTIFIDQVYEFYKNGDLSWADVEGEVITMITAAFESTAHTLHAALLFLGMYPKYQDILYEEIMSVCPEDDIDVTYEHIRQMPYSEMVINETMRVIATVPIVARQATADLTLDNGLFIAKGVNILLDIYHLHRNKKIWGSKAEEFNPDNFLKENITKKHPYSFMPFTKGLRNCIGWRYAIFSLQILLVHILKKYKVTTKWKLEEIECIEYLTMCYEQNPTLEFTYRN